MKEASRHVRKELFSNITMSLTWYDRRQKAILLKKTLCRCWRQKRSRGSVKDCRRKRSCNKRGKYSEVPSLSLSYNLPAFGALWDKFRPVRYLFLRFSVMFGFQLRFRRKNFRGAAKCECPNILGALLYFEKKTTNIVL